MIDPDRYSDVLAAFINSDNQMKAAALFADGFTPDPEKVAAGEYDWVVEYAPKLWDARFAIYQKLDDKATSVMTWLGGTLGLLGVGLTLAVSDGRVPWQVAVAFLFPLAAAIAAVVVAWRARVARRIYPVPYVKLCLDRVAENGKGARVAVLGVWHIAITRLGRVTGERSWLVDVALLLSMLAGVLLVVPLATAIFMRVWP